MYNVRNITHSCHVERLCFVIWPYEGYEGYGESASSLYQVYDVLTRNPEITSVGEKEHLLAVPEQKRTERKKKPKPIVLH